MLHRVFSHLCETSHLFSCRNTVEHRSGSADVYPGGFIFFRPAVADKPPGEEITDTDDPIQFLKLIQQNSDYLRDVGQFVLRGHCAALLV